MTWIALALLLVAFQRGWVLAPMVLFVLPFALPIIEVPLVHRGIDPSWLVPDAVEGFGAQLVSVGGLLVLSLHQRRF
jgi:hypothetical protein